MIDQLRQPDERALHLVSRGSYEYEPAGRLCRIAPMIEASDIMTWHDKSHGTETRQAPAYAHHSGTLLTALSVLRCRKYHPQTGNSVYIGRTYDTVRDFHEDGAGHMTNATLLHHLPLAHLKVIQQLMVTKMNVCPHPKAVCIVPLVDHLGVYGFIVPIENLALHMVRCTQCFPSMNVVLGSEPNNRFCPCEWGSEESFESHQDSLDFVQLRMFLNLICAVKFKLKPNL
eukprot:1162889-Amphidinium_carterae.3